MTGPPGHVTLIAFQMLDMRFGGSCLVQDLTVFKYTGTAALHSSVLRVKRSGSEGPTNLNKTRPALTHEASGPKFTLNRGKRGSRPTRSEKYVSIRKDCGRKLSGPGSYDISEFFVLFKGMVRSNYEIGWKLLFHFVPPPQAPRPLASSGHWNCSAASSAAVRHIFPCNLKSDCVGGEDEAACPYTSQPCGPGNTWCLGVVGWLLKASATC